MSGTNFNDYQYFLKEIDQILIACVDKRKIKIHKIDDERWNLPFMKSESLIKVNK